MITADDLPRLKWSIAALVASLIAAAGALWHLDQELGRASYDRDDAERRYREARKTYLTARRDESRMRETIDRFRTLERAGMVGEEARLDWIEHLARARQAAGLRRLEYELRPRRKLAEAAAAPSHQLTASTMKITSRLAHAGRALAFLDELSTEPTALMRVQTCKLSRPTATEAEADQLALDCELDWVTVNPPEIDGVGQ